MSMVWMIVTLVCLFLFLELLELLLELLFSPLAVSANDIVINFVDFFHVKKLIAM